MIQYYAELSLWISMMFLAGCPLGALARLVHDKWRPTKGGEP